MSPGQQGLWSPLTRSEVSVHGQQCCRCVLCSPAGVSWARSHCRRGAGNRQWDSAPVSRLWLLLSCQCVTPLTPSHPIVAVSLWSSLPSQPCCPPGAGMDTVPCAGEGAQHSSCPVPPTAGEVPLEQSLRGGAPRGWRWGELSEWVQTGAVNSPTPCSD